MAIATKSNALSRQYRHLESFIRSPILPWTLLMFLLLYIAVDKFCPREIVIFPRLSESALQTPIDLRTSNDDKILARHLSGSSSSSNGHSTGHQHDAMFFLFVMVVLGTGVTHLSVHPKLHWLQQTVVLFVLGVLASVFQEGIMGELDSKEDMGMWSRSYDMWMAIDPHLLLFTLLPALLAGDAMTIDTAIARRVAKQCIYLATVGVVVNAMLTALFLWWYIPYDWSFLLSLTLGSILCATDPVAVVALLKELGAPPTLTVQIQGESLLNDGSAIVLYTLAYNALKGEDYDVADVLIFLAKTALGAVGLGLGMGWIFYCWIGAAYNKLEEHSSMVQISLSLSCAYWSFILAEGVFKMSGVLATVCAALVLADKMWPVITSKESMHTVWHVFEYLGNSVIFFLAGALTGKIMVRIEWSDYVHLIVIYLVTTVIRFLMLVMSRPVLRYFGRENKQDVAIADIMVMTWGGLRGAVGLALAIQVSIDKAGGEIDSKDADRVLFYVGGVAALTLVINATTAPVLVHWLGVAALPETKQRILLMIHDHLFRLLDTMTKDKVGLQDEKVIELETIMNNMENRILAHVKHDSVEDGSDETDDDWQFRNSLFSGETSGPEPVGFARTFKRKATELLDATILSSLVGGGTAPSKPPSAAPSRAGSVEFAETPSTASSMTKAQAKFNGARRQSRLTRLNSFGAGGQGPLSSLAVFQKRRGERCQTLPQNVGSDVQGQTVGFQLEMQQPLQMLRLPEAVNAEPSTSARSSACATEAISQKSISGFGSSWDSEAQQSKMSIPGVPENTAEITRPTLKHASTFDLGRQVNFQDDAKRRARQSSAGCRLALVEHEESEDEDEFTELRLRSTSAGSNLASLLAASDSELDSPVSHSEVNNTRITTINTGDVTPSKKSRPMSVLSRTSNKSRVSKDSMRKSNASSTSVRSILRFSGTSSFQQPRRVSATATASRSMSSMASMRHSISEFTMSLKHSVQVGVKSANNLLAEVDDLRAKVNALPKKYLNLLGDLPSFPDYDEDSAIRECIKGGDVDAAMLWATNEALLNLVYSQYWHLIDAGDVMSGTNQAEILLTSVKLALSNCRGNLADIKFVKLFVQIPFKKAMAFEAQHLEQLNAQQRNSELGIMPGGIAEKAEVRNERLRVMVESTAFNAIIMFVIILTLVFWGIEEQFRKGDNENNVGWFIADATFTGVFLFEFVVRFIDLRCNYFRDSWNKYDFFVCCIGIFGVYVNARQVFSSSEDTSLSPNIIRFARLFRVLRVLRIFKLVRFWQVTKARMMNKELSLEVAERVQKISVLVCFIKAHIVSQGLAFKFFGEESLKEVAELAYSIIESQIACSKAMLMAVMEQRQLDQIMLKEVHEMRQRKKVAEDLQGFLVKAHHDGILSSKEAEELMVPLKAQIKEANAKIRETHFGLVSKQQDESVDVYPSSENSNGSAKVSNNNTPPESPRVVISDGS